MLNIIVSLHSWLSTNQESANRVDGKQRTCTSLSSLGLWKGEETGGVVEQTRVCV